MEWLKPSARAAMAQMLLLKSSLLPIACVSAPALAIHPKGAQGAPSIHHR